MAIINNLSASLTSFLVNSVTKSLLNSGGSYNTSVILNGGETYDEESSTLNILSYGFSITGLQDHTIKNIVVNSLLLTKSGDLTDTGNFTLSLDGVIVNGNISSNASVKTYGSTTFSLNKQITSNKYDFTLDVKNNNSKSCYYSVSSITVNLQDIQYKINITFSGPTSGRTASSIVTACLLLNLNAIDVTFSKDSVQAYNAGVDATEGKIYFRLNGIFVDGYLYGVNAKADETTFGIVKVKNAFDVDLNNAVIAPTEANVVPTVQLLYNVVLDITNGVIAGPTGSSSQAGIVKLSSTFQTSDGAIIAPTESGVAATPQLVFNAIATAKNYTDEVVAPLLEIINGIDAPLKMDIEDINGETKSLGDELTFSNDFELIDKKLYIKWIEITSDGKIN